MGQDGIESFVRKDDFTELFESRVKEHLRSSNLNSVVSTFDPSHLTECPRRIIYRTTSVVKTKTDLTSNTLDELDSHYFFNSIIRSSGTKIISENISASDCNYNIVGKLDYVLNLNGETFATKFYVVGDDDFRNVLKKGAVRKDVIEIMVYMWMVELNNGLIFYWNRSDNQITSFHIKPFKPIIKSVVDKCKFLLEYELKGTMPDRTYKTRSSNECKQCEFESVCWEN